MSKKYHNTNPHNVTPADISKQSGAEMEAAELPEVSPAEAETGLPFDMPEDDVTKINLNDDTEMPLPFDMPENTEPEDGVTEIKIDGENEKVDNVIALSKRYKFEGAIISTIDLTGLENINGMTLQKIEHIYRKTTKSPVASPELTLDYALVAASVLTGLPLEFFTHIGGRDAIKIKNRVVNFLYSED